MDRRSAMSDQCAAINRAGDRCRRESIEFVCNGQFGFCPHHFHRVWQSMSLRGLLPPLEESWVYFLEKNGLVKIGTTTNLDRRMRELGGGFLRLAVPGGVALEANLHQRLDHLRVHGEWFRDEDDLVLEIIRLRDLLERTAA